MWDDSISQYRTQIYSSQKFAKETTIPARANVSTNSFWRDFGLPKELNHECFTPKRIFTQSGQGHTVILIDNSSKNNFVILLSQQGVIVHGNHPSFCPKPLIQNIATQKKGWQHGLYVSPSIMDMCYMGPRPYSMSFKEHQHKSFQASKIFKSKSVKRENYIYNVSLTIWKEERCLNMFTCPKNTSDQNYLTTTNFYLGTYSINTFFC